VIHALAQNRYFPKALAKIDERTGIPYASLWVAFILGLIFLLPFPAWQQLVGLVSSATVFTYAIGPVSAAVLRRTHPDAKRPYKLGGMSVIAPIAFVVASLIIYWTGWNIDWKLLVTLLIGVVLYLIFSAIMPNEIERPDAKSIGAGVWLVVYLLFMLGMSYVGSARFGAAANGGKGIIHYPMDLIVVVVASLIFYYWGVASGLHTQMADEAVQAVAIEAGD
jgi:amino acid transporter